MIRSGTTSIVCGLVACAAFSAPSLADVVQLNPSKDNTLYESDTGATSNGQGIHFFAGRTATGDLRRGLLAFDLSTIPAGSTINSVSLTLMNDRGTGNFAFDLHRMTANWGEGTSNAGTASDGMGVASTPGDATWIHASFPNVLWSTPGGDFIQTASASTNVSTQDFYTWSSATMAADVQGWLNSPATNFGWMLKGNEVTNHSARRFVGSESTNTFIVPVLEVNYTVPTPGALALAGAAMFLGTRRRRA